MHDLEFKVTYR